MIDTIITILKRHEQYLSDGFNYYMPSWHPEYGDIEKSDGFLKIVAAEILAALDREVIMSAEEQTKILADYIMAELPGEPSQDQGAGRTAVRLLKQYRGALDRIVHELGVPGSQSPVPVKTKGQ